MMPSGVATKRSTNVLRFNRTLCFCVLLASALGPQPRGAPPQGAHSQFLLAWRERHPDSGAVSPRGGPLGWQPALAANPASGLGRA